MLETGLSPLARGRGKAVDLVGETDMTDILIRILLGGLGVFLFFLGVAMLVVRGIAGSLRSIFAPRVIIIQNDSTYEPERGLERSLMSLNRGDSRIAVVVIQPAGWAEASRDGVF